MQKKQVNKKVSVISLSNKIKRILWEMQFAECKPKKRGRPVSESSGNKRASMRGILCTQKRKRDNKKIYYRTEKGKKQVSKEKQTKQDEKRKRLFRKLGLIKKEGITSKEEIKDTVSQIKEGRIKTFKKINELRKKWKKTGAEKSRIKGAAKQAEAKQQEKTNQENFDLLKKMYQDHKFRKSYLAGSMPITELYDMFKPYGSFKNIPEFHDFLKDLQNKNKISLQICSCPNLEPRSCEGIHSGRGIQFYMKIEGLEGEEAKGLKKYEILKESAPGNKELSKILPSSMVSETDAGLQMPKNKEHAIRNMQSAQRTIDYIQNKYSSIPEYTKIDDNIAINKKYKEIPRGEKLALAEQQKILYENSISREYLNNLSSSEKKKAKEKAEKNLHAYTASINELSNKFGVNTILDKPVLEIVEGIKKNHPFKIKQDIIDKPTNIKDKNAIVREKDPSKGFTKTAESIKEDIKQETGIKKILKESGYE